jgi:hypothetical protein
MRFGVVFMRIKKENPLDKVGFGRAGPGPELLFRFDWTAYTQWESTVLSPALIPLAMLCDIHMILVVLIDSHLRICYYHMKIFQSHSYGHCV